MVPMPAPSTSKKSNKTIPAQVQDFVALPLLLLPAQHSYPREESTHYLYLRPNRPRLPTASTDREVFCVNVPIDSTLGGLRRLFAEELGGGRVEDVEFEENISGLGRGRGRGIRAPAVVGSDGAGGKKGKKRKRGAEVGKDGEGGDGGEVGQLPVTWDRELHRSGATAVVRFVDATSAGLALRAASKAAKNARAARWPASSPPGESGERDTDQALGESRYRTHHALRHPSHDDLQTSVEAYMSAFAAQEESTARELARKRAEPDEDGFITVTRGGRNPAARAQQESNGGAVAGGEDHGGGMEEKKKKKRHKGHVEEGFYRFQVRERKKREYGELARKFEEDGRRVEELRRRRGGRVRPE